MGRKPLFALIVFLIVATVAGVTMPQSYGEAKETLMPDKVLRHVVLFKFKETATPEDITKVEQAFAGLKAEIPTIIDFEWGTDVSVENLSQGFTHCFFVSFASAEDRDEYLPNPQHKEFVALAGPYLEQALVVDYWAQR